MMWAMVAVATAFAVSTLGSLAATTAGGGPLVLVLGYSPGVSPLGQVLSGGCSADTASTVGTSPAGGAVVNTGNNSYAGQVSITFSATSACSNALGDSSAATTVSVNGTNGPSTLSCSFNAFYARVAAAAFVDGPGACLVDGVDSGPVLLAVRLLVTPTNSGGVVIVPMTSSVAVGSWSIQPASS
jgi:hypothetical protein